MAVVSVNSLLESGVHYGHQKKRWNPKMGEYIWGPKEDIHLIDLYKTAQALENVYAKIADIVSKDGELLFVGTKKQAQEVTKEEATRCGMFYMNQRWLGGTLTNFKTIKNRIRRLEEIEKMEENGTFDLLPKKEVFGIKKEYDKLNSYLQGIRNMKKMPAALIVVDTIKEVNAIREAKKLNIPVFGMIDTNCDPDVVDYVIPSNDDAIKSIKIIFSVIANAVNSVKGGDIADYVYADEGKLINMADIAAKPFAQKRDNRNNRGNNRPFNKKFNDRNDRPRREFNPNFKKEENNRNKEVKETKEVVASKNEVKENKVDFSSLTVAKLREIAKEKEIAGYTTMKKDELINALK